jgi:hypothetical protein
MTKRLIIIITTVLVVTVTIWLYSIYVYDGFPVDQIQITLSANSGIVDAEELATSVGGKLQSGSVEVNTYILQLPTRTAYARNTSIKKLSSDKRVLGVSPVGGNRTEQ